MEYDVFISYKSEERPWARRLHEELKKIGVRAFYDQDPADGLVAGRPWEKALTDALAASGALVAIWSQSAAKMNTWNDRERFAFEVPELRSPIVEGRPVMYVLLDAEPTALSATHLITDLKSAGGYPDIAKVTAEVWATVARRIKRGARSDGKVYVETLVLAATADEMRESEAGKPLWEKISRRAAEIGVGAPIGDRYGTTRWQWKPYGSQTVEEMLHGIEDDARENAKDDLIFEAADEGIWSDDPGVAEEAGKQLAGRLSLILVDPLSLFLEPVHSRVAYLSRCQESPTTAFAVLAPQATNDGPLNLLTSTYISGLYRSFLYPPRPPVPNAPAVGLNIRNAQELLRVMLTAHARATANPVIDRPRHAKTSMGGVA